MKPSEVLRVAKGECRICERTRPLYPLKYRRQIVVKACANCLSALNEGRIVQRLVAWGLARPLTEIDRAIALAEAEE